MGDWIIHFPVPIPVPACLRFYSGYRVPRLQAGPVGGFHTSFNAFAFLSFPSISLFWRSCRGASGDFSRELLERRLIVGCLGGFAE